MAPVLVLFVMVKAMKVLCTTAPGGSGYPRQVELYPRVQVQHPQARMSRGFRIFLD